MKRMPIRSITSKSGSHSRNEQPRDYCGYENRTCAMTSMDEGMQIERIPQLIKKIMPRGFRLTSDVNRMTDPPTETKLRGNSSCIAQRSHWNTVDLELAVSGPETGN
jgi:hypothetical protein